MKISRKSVWDIDGESIAERIQERRERIKTRMEAAKKMHKLVSLKKTLGMFKDEDENKDFVAKASSDGSKHIFDMDGAGLELVTNVQLSAQHEYVDYMTKTRKKNQELKKQLKLEEQMVEKKFEEIMKKWSCQGKGPTNLFEEVLEQRNRCSEVLNSKNNIIEILEDEHRAADEAFKDLINSFSENINVISERMESHFKTFEDTTSAENRKLERSFQKQKNLMLKQTDSNFSKSLEVVSEKCEEDLKSRLDLVIEQEKEMNEMINNDAAKLAETKMNTEENVRALEEEIGMIQALTYLNTERLDYEIHVLQKHEEENSLIKSEQKRKITSLQDQANKLRLKVMECDKGMDRERAQLVENIKNMKKQLSDMEVKQQKFGAQSARKRSEMATMMKNEAYRMLENIARNDEVLELFYLKLPFLTRRDSDVTLQSLSLLRKIDKQRHSVASMTHIPSFGRRGSVIKSIRSSKSSSAESDKIPKKDLTKDIKATMLTLIDKADFLIDDDINQLMEALPSKDKLLVKVDGILNSLRVDKAKDLHRIVSHLSYLGDDNGNGQETEEDQGNLLSLAEKRSQVDKFKFCLLYQFIFVVAKSLETFC